MKYLYKPKAEFLLCGDININYLHENNCKKYLSSLLTAYNISHTVDCAARTQNKSSSAIDNIFVVRSRMGSNITSPLINGLSYHDAQLLAINNIYAAKKVFLRHRTRTVNRETLSNFQSLLKEKNHDNLFIKHRILIT